MVDALGKFNSLKILQYAPIGVFVEFLILPVAAKFAEFHIPKDHLSCIMYTNLLFVLV